MEKSGKKEPTWKLEDQEWWIKYSAMVRSGEIESLDDNQGMVVCCSSGNVGSGSYAITGSGSAGSGLMIRYVSSGSGSGSGLVIRYVGSGSGSGNGVMTYGLGLI